MLTVPHVADCERLSTSLWDIGFVLVRESSALAISRETLELYVVMQDSLYETSPRKPTLADVILASYQKNDIKVTALQVRSTVASSDIDRSCARRWGRLQSSVTL